MPDLSFLAKVLTLQDLMGRAKMKFTGRYCNVQRHNIILDLTYTRQHVVLRCVLVSQVISESSNQKCNVSTHLYNFAWGTKP